MKVVNHVMTFDTHELGKQSQWHDVMLHGFIGMLKAEVASEHQLRFHEVSDPLEARAVIHGGGVRRAKSHSRRKTAQ